MNEETRDVIVQGLIEIIQTTRNNAQKMEAIKMLLDIEKGEIYE